jgi:hypothetical protein
VIRWFITALIALSPLAAEAAPVACRIPKLKSFEMRSRASLRCSEMIEVTRQALKPSPRTRHAEVHVRMVDVSTPREIRFEARAWAITAKGRHLRHVSRAVATAKDRAGGRNLVARVARLALTRVLRELAEE